MSIKKGEEKNQYSVRWNKTMYITCFKPNPAKLSVQQFKS